MVRRRIRNPRPHTTHHTGIGILATANRLLNQAERVQAEQVAGATAPAPASAGRGQA